MQSERRWGASPAYRGRSDSNASPGDVENSIADICILQMNDYLDSQDTVENAVSSLTGNTAYQKGRALLKESIVRKVMDGIRDMEPADIIAEEGKRAVSQKLGEACLPCF